MAYNDGYRPDEYEENVRRVRRPAQNETPRQNGQNGQRRRVTYTDGTPANTQRRVRPESDAAAYGQQRRPAAQNGQRRPVSAEGQQHRPSAPVNGQQRRPTAQNGQRRPVSAEGQQHRPSAPVNGQQRRPSAPVNGQQRRPAAQNGQRRPVSAEGQQHRPSAPVNGQQRRPAAANAQRSPYNGGRGGYTGNHGNGGNRGNGGYGGGNRGRGGYGGGNGGNGRFDGPDHRKRDGKPIGICKALAIEMFVMILAAAGFFVVMLMRSQMLNAKLTAVVIAVCAAIAAVVGFLGWVHAYKQNITKGKQRAAFIASIVVSVLFTVVFIIGGVYVMKTVSTIRNVGGVTHEISNYHVYVLEDDPAENIQDAADYTFGILETQDRENVGQIIEDIEEELGTTIQVEEYPGVTGLADALNSHEVGAMIMGETFLDMFASFEGYETFADTVRSIWTGTIETEIETVSEELSNIVTIYISGSDTRNSTLPTRSLSDVNLILRMNLDTHQALIISTPRDYYVYTSVSGGMRDKLTHAGAYGVQCSMDTLSSLYETDIDYYVRLNFVGFVDIIDALGGIDVWSDHTFTTGNMIGYTIYEGYNHMDGATALAFSRERYAFADGDNQRGRDQMEVLKGIINACTSPQILANYMDVLNSVDGCFETSIPYSVMADLVRFQLDYGGDWDIVTYSVYGTGDSQPTFSTSSNAFVFIPDQSTVDVAIDLLDRMEAGEVISAPNADPGE